MNPEKIEDDEEQRAFLPNSGDSEDEEHESRGRRGKKSRVMGYLRFLLEFAMASTIVFLLFFKPAPAERSFRKSPVPKCTSSRTSFSDRILMEQRQIL